ncbi:MAG: hypothetical protein K8U03_22360 [Planctomycetia bacterium]|nr:hypothetical protein [Planctomycetia bacterium]
MSKHVNGRIADRSALTHTFPSPAKVEHTSAGIRRARRVRVRAASSDQREFMPPETWHEPQEQTDGYRFVVQPAGAGFRHVVTVDEVRERLSRLPAEFLAPLQVVQLSRMTRKKRSMPLYGMQWGTALYLYPIEADLVESYAVPPSPAQLNEARMYGGKWEAVGGRWRLTWTLAAAKDFYLNNILIHELGHLLDNRNTRTVDRERYAEWFAVQYGYLPTQVARRQALSLTGREVVRRHARH